MAYRITIQEVESTGNGDVQMDCIMETDVSGSWEQITNGHRTLVLDGEAVLAIKASGALKTEQRTQLIELMKQEVLAWGLEKSDEAAEHIVYLAPPGTLPDLPITIPL